MSFEDAVKKVEDVSEDEGFTILLTKGMHDMFKKKLLMCAATLAKKAMDISTKMALVMPCSFVVSEENGKVFVSHSSIMKMGVELGLAPELLMQPLVDETGIRVHKIWDRI
ncbi:MAG: DUF302 domain-containing protein [Candidatus Thorarchaeota archaeon]